MLKQNIVPAVWGTLKDGIPPSITAPRSQPLAPLSGNSGYSPWRTLPACHAEYNPATGLWFTVMNSPTATTPHLFQGTNYVASDKGLYTAADKKGESQLISSATIHVIALKERWVDDGTHKDSYILEVSCRDWHGEVKTMEIPVEKYKQAYPILRKNFPGIFFADANAAAVEAYLTDAFNKSCNHMKRIVDVEPSGWMEINGMISYWKGCGEHCASMDIPAVAPTRYSEIFQKGLRFLSVGKNQWQICLIWLYAHLGYMLYWMKRSSAVSMFVLYVKGRTGSLKTSVVRELSNVFDHDRGHATTRMTSTRASIASVLSNLRDTCICVDDYSNSSVRDSRSSEDNAEFVIRAVGDGILTEKMNVRDFSKAVRKTVRSAVIMTGEEKLSLGASSMLRVIEIPIDEYTFSGEALRIFQEDSEILRCYFSLFVQYLAEHGHEITAAYGQLQNDYRERYAHSYHDKRYIDAAVLLRVAIDVLSGFSAFCGVALPENLLQKFDNSILTGVTHNSQEARCQKPELRFLIALLEVVDTSQNSKVADNEDCYVGSEDNFIGFWEAGNDLLWIRWDSAFKLVHDYYQRIGEPWMIKETTIKEQLLHLGLSKGKLKGEGSTGNEYLIRAKKGKRQRMLVLQMKNIHRYMEENAK